MAKQHVRQVSIFINGKQVENSIKAISAEQRKLTNELALTVRGTVEYESKAAELAKVNTILRQHREAVSGIKKGWDLTKVGLQSFVGVAAGAFAVDSLIGYGKQLFNTGVKMEALANKAKVVFGDALPQITAEADKNARAMGLTNAQYVAAAANIQDLLVPMGFQRKAAADISAQLVNLSGALSEWTGGQRSATEVADILQAALLGERERLKELGISIKEADVTAQLAAKGLDKLTGASLEQAKASATLELILAKSADAQAQFAVGADSAVRRQAELTAKIQEIAEKVATLLLPVFETLAGVIGGVVDIIGDVVDSMQEMTGAQNKASDSTREQQEEFNALIGILKNVNTDEETRARAINELQTKYPAYIGNIDLHKATEDQLNQVLKSGNDLFAKRIFLQSKEEKIFDLETKRNELQQTLFEAEKKLAAARAGQDVQFGLDQAGEIAKYENVVGAIKQKLKNLQDVQDAFLKEQDEFAKRFNILPGETSASTGTVPPTPTKPGGGGDKKQAEKLAKDLEDLIKRTTDLRLDLISKAQDDELALTIRSIEKRYDAEIAKALELEKKGVEEATAQRIALEQLKQEEITLAIRQSAEKAREEQEETDKRNKEDALKKELDYWAKVADQREKFLEEKATAEEEIKQFTQENLLTDQELELAQLEEHYKTLLDAAKKYGFDTVAITEAYTNAKNDILAKGNEYEEELAAAQVELQLAKVEAFQQSAAILSGFFDETSALGKALFLFEKAAAAVSVILNLQKEKAAIFAATRLGTIFDPTGALGAALAAPQIAAANIRAGLSLATIAATAIKEVSVKQKASGGYLAVTGEQDRRQYNASVIPAPYTGLLPPHPVLFQSQATGKPVLASERGQEYFVSADALRNPYVANLTRMIDNIAGGRSVRQFAEGGVNPPTAGTSPIEGGQGGENAAAMRDLAAAVNTLNTLLARGIIAVIPDGTVVDINERFGKINRASGGYFG